MILRNISNMTVKRYENGVGWLVAAPGMTVTVSDEAGDYLLKTEKYWERADTPEPKANPTGTHEEPKAEPKAKATRPKPKKTSAKAAERGGA